MWFEFVIHKEATMVSQTIHNMLNSPGAFASGNSSASIAEILGVGIKNPEIQNFEIPDLPSGRDEEKGWVVGPPRSRQT
ncbi:unnamed protein product [Malus baccata var. baccata]